MKLINVPEELIVEAKQVLYLEDAVRTVIRELTKEITKNHILVTELWNKVDAEAKKQGITKSEDEAYNFDYITDTFAVVKRPK